MCDAALEVCCRSRSDAFVTGCYDKAMGCGLFGIGIGCDEAADCEMQGNCCILAAFQGGGDGTVGCVLDACITGQLCISDAECPAGRTCTDRARSEGYVACQ
jgi:hypothetical protein